MKTLFWFSIAIIFYVYLGYPILIHLLSLFYKKPVKIKYVYPMASIILPVHNEEEHIEEKLNSLMHINYPEGRYEILIGSDGSTDRTNEIVTQLTAEKKRIKFFRQERRQGKCNMINFLVNHATGEIVVFTRARQEWDINALEQIVRNFSDRKVGSVSGALFYKNKGNSKAERGVGMYWEYEKFIRKSESGMGSMLGATGALYAIRRELFPQLPKDLILDDIYIPMKIVEKGYRAVFDSKAKVYDKVFKTPKEEFSRRSRTLAGNFQLLIYLKELFNPFRGKISWQFFSHKFLRLTVPFLLIAIFIINALLLDSALYKFFFILQISFYALALLGLIFKQKNRVIDIPYMFCVMNSAAAVGLYRLLTRRQDVLWEKTDIVG